jgi:hypothetical protein
MGDVWVMNVNEMIFALLAMFFGLSLNGMVIGSIMSLVTDASEEKTRIYRNIESLSMYLKVCIVYYVLHYV